MWLLLLFSLACPVFNFCSRNFPFVCLWCKKKRGICLCSIAWRLSGFGRVREQFSSVDSFCQQRRFVEFIVVNRLFINQTKTKQTNPFPRSDESLMSSANSI